MNTKTRMACGIAALHNSFFSAAIGMIDHRSCLVFIRNPKTATRSLQMGFSGKEGLKPWAHPRLEQFDHLTPEHYPQQYLRNYTVVVSVRNPIDRAASMWRYARKKGALREFERIEQWAEAGCPPPGIFKNEKRSGVDVMDQAQYIPSHTNLIIRLETIEKDFDRVCRLLALSKRELERRNTTTTPVEQLSERTLSSLRDRFCADAAAIGYEI